MKKYFQMNIIGAFIIISLILFRQFNNYEWDWSSFTESQQLSYGILLVLWLLTLLGTLVIFIMKIRR